MGRKDTHPSVLSQAETILFIKMIRFRYPYLEFRETKLGVISWHCLEPPVYGLPEHWMLVYLYRHQETIRAYLSEPFEGNQSAL